MKIQIILGLSFLVLLTAACTGQPVEETESVDGGSSQESPEEDLPRLSIKGLPLLEGYSLDEKREPWERVKEDTDAAFSQTFVKPTGSPTVVILDAREYKTLEKAREVYNKLYEEETAFGTRTERNKEDTIMGGLTAKISNIRPDTGSYVVQVEFLDGKTVIMVLVTDFLKYREDVATEIAEIVAEKI
jgi:hypothetical protein